MTTNEIPTPFDLLGSPDPADDDRCESCGAHLDVDPHERDCGNAKFCSGCGEQCSSDVDLIEHEARCLGRCEHPDGCDEEATYLVPKTRRVYCVEHAREIDGPAVFRLVLVPDGEL